MHVAAVLEKEEPQIVSQQQRDSLERLLPPSLVSTKEHQNIPPRVLSAGENAVFYFAYGANLSLACLRRRLVSPISRSPAVVLDPSIKMVFQHRGGGCVAAAGRC